MDATTVPKISAWVTGADSNPEPCIFPALSMHRVLYCLEIWPLWSYGVISPPMEGWMVKLLDNVSETEEMQMLWSVWQCLVRKLQGGKFYRGTQWLWILKAEDETRWQTAVRDQEWLSYPAFFTWSLKIVQSFDVMLWTSIKLQIRKRGSANLNTANWIRILHALW